MLPPLSISQCYPYEYNFYLYLSNIWTFKNSTGQNCTDHYVFHVNCNTDVNTVLLIPLFCFLGNLFVTVHSQIPYLGTNVCCCELLTLSFYFWISVYSFQNWRHNFLYKSCFVCINMSVNFSNMTPNLIFSDGHSFISS